MCLHATVSSWIESAEITRALKVTATTPFPWFCANCSNCSRLAIDLLHSYSKPSIHSTHYAWYPATLYVQGKFEQQFFGLHTMTLIDIMKQNIKWKSIHNGGKYDSGFRIQEMFIQYNYISNLFTYRAHRLSWLGQLSGICKLMRLINVKFENGIMVYHGFRGKYSAQSQENRNNLYKTSLASSGDFH